MAPGRPVLRTATITYADVLLIESAFDNYRESSATEVITKLFEGLGWRPNAEELLKSDLKASIEAKILHLSALLAQLFSVGLVTYTRGHSREFAFAELSRSVEEFQFFGHGSLGLRLRAKRVQLQCLGDMLHRKVWMFSMLSAPVELQEPGKYDVYSTIEDLCDIWGGRIVVEDKSGSPQVQLYIGEGVLCEAPSSNAAAFGYAISAQLHYKPEGTTDRVPVDVLRPSNRVLVGATLINGNCKLSRKACHAYLSSSANFVHMGTRPASWKTTGRSATVGGGAKGFTFSLNMSQTRDNGKTLKAQIIENKSWKALNSPWGLELSLCTGIARRVPLRKLLYGEVLKYLKQELDEWPTIHGLIEGLVDCENDEFSCFIGNLGREQKVALRKATELLLLAMEHTGTRDGDNLVLWWPEADEEPRGFRIKKEWFAGRNPWLPVIKDSEYCAVFGLVSSRCLQYHGLKTCKNLETAPFTPLKDIVLDTSVFIVTPTPVQAFVLGQLLVMWKERDVLRVAKLSGPQDTVVQLEYRGRMPRLALKMLTTKYEVREQQAIRDVSQNVWIFQER